ncbi:MAG: hypothetical protein EOP83_10815, partial [Verrucomicrobiaceae bacterium]
MNREPGHARRKKIRWRLAIAGGILGILGLASCGLTTRLVSEAIVQPARKGVSAPVPKDLAARTFVLPDKVEMRVWEARPSEVPKAAILV